MKRALQVSLLVFLFLIVGHSAAQAQFSKNRNPYWEGEITLVDGTVRKGLIRVPSFLDEKRIALKQDSNAKREFIKRLDIKSLTVYSPNGKTYVYENVPYIIRTNSKKINKPIFITLHKGNNYAKIYYTGSRYVVNKKSGMIESDCIFPGFSPFCSAYYFIWKSGDEYANRLLTIIFYDDFEDYKNQLFMGLLRYLTEVPSVVQKIENKDLNINQLEEVFDLYLEGTKDM